MSAGCSLACGGNSPLSPSALQPPIGATPGNTTPPGVGEPGPAVPVPPPAPTPPPGISRTHFLAFGDSLTAGTTSPALALLAMNAGLPQSYPFKLEALLRSRYSDQTIEISNEGKPGEAAADGVARFPSVLKAAAPEVVFLLHGVNDVTFAGMSGVRRVADFVNTMARDARFGGAQVVICTYPMHRAGGFRAADPAVIAAYNGALRDVARGEGALLAD